MAPKYNYFNYHGGLTSKEKLRNNAKQPIFYIKIAENFLFYQRIAKTASTSVKELLKKRISTNDGDKNAILVRGLLKIMQDY